MAVRDHLPPGLGARTRVKILTVDPVNRRIEATMKDGTMIHIAVWEVPSAFRWPQENEIWIVRRDSGIWMLDRRQQESKDERTVPVTSLPAGAMLLDSPDIYNAKGQRLATVTSSHPVLAFSGSLSVLRVGTGATHTLVAL